MSAAPFINTHIPDVNVSRTGYNEVDLMNYEAKSVKFGASLNYRPMGDDRLELIWNSKYGTGNTVYQGQNRYSLVNFLMEQHKLEVKGKNFFVRGYYTSEDAGDSYDTRFTALNINREWKDHRVWFGEYVGSFFQGVTNGLTATQAHTLARSTADTGRVMPGTSEFDNLLNKVTSDPNVVTGSQLKDNTNYYHADGNLNLRDYIDWAEVQVGGSYRTYKLNSSGTIYTDGSGPITFDEFGVYTQLQKKFMDDRLKFTGSVRYDKSQNFDGNFTPRISLAYAAGESRNHNFRASFQTGFRNPTTQDQYIGLNSGSSVLLGSAPDNPARYTINVQDVNTGNTFVLSGSDAFTRGYSESSITAGTPTLASTSYVKPEKVKSFEVGYRGALPLGENRLTVDFSTYYNMYSDFIATKNVIVLADPSIPVTVANLQGGLARTFNLKTNSTADVDSYGAGLGLSTKVFNGFNVGVNYTWSKFKFDQASDPDFEAGFNTPEHKVKAQFGHPNVFKNFGFNVNARWQNSFYWESTFLEGTVADRTVIDAQVNYKSTVY